MPGIRSWPRLAWITTALACLVAFTLYLWTRTNHTPMFLHSQPIIPSPQPSHSTNVSEAQATNPEVGHGDNVAVIIEAKMGPNLIPIMVHFAYVLGPTWKMVLYTFEESWTMPDSAPFLRLVNSGFLRIAFLPADTDFSTQYKVSVFLTRPWLWQQLQPAHRVLLFQLDSILCSASNQTVDDWLQYDLVGAPIRKGFGHGYNGGLSLRNPKMMLDIAIATTTTKDHFGDEPRPGVSNFEDQWFFQRMQERGAHMPDEDVAKQFAVETVWYERPLGYHQPFRYLQGKDDEIKAWCPEVGLLVPARLS